ncbi:MAG: hypothetical protein PHO20_04855 [Candidatus Peribacteraceae bacterium]|nr:hypothetical protein [Candidatus Peribacteraceae bacterium]MDD5740065.1 hypothetical protein [Candidatus Peribacteraceae bacterium]
MTLEFDQMKQAVISDLKGRSGNGHGNPIFQLIEANPQNNAELLRALESTSERIPGVIDDVVHKYRNLLTPAEHNPESAPTQSTHPEAPTA